MRWIQDILHTTPSILPVADGKHDAAAVDDHRHRIDYKSSKDEVPDGCLDDGLQQQQHGAKGPSDGDQGELPYRIEYPTDRVKSVIPSIIIHYPVPKEL